MKVENAVHPDPSNIKPFIETDGKVCMVNLLKFREKAAYPDGRDPELSGREAYLRYGQAMMKLVEAAGGRFVFAAEVKGLLLGEVEELWDEVAIVEYPSSKALIEIASTPEFREIEAHREAGLAGQLNLTTSARGGL
ncbi:MAG: DUF1330 domain-containing protein [bacterium]|nr:DUF1330 domain-containing protein [bacterium]